ncbi:hypothetical protein CEUSTIGMA_g4189.t1 [Chlamydomonas eustigma]|uniref:Uncharacterized protein n=1 Tax=Chlamydomonas eustigma TaxID=1157962 RepID=A0A250X1H5_9CHLO|nr:hypothetical protein CEUSTIGMA_g4189.t1 [Chlamydomonas eustigma]|eukprot:GAX76742.1 hypothetical protein CEUSTIGMA_g4189.t1 [Chlamydomonas eustigma]
MLKSQTSKKDGVARDDGSLAGVRLLQRFDTKPTSSRLIQGLKDVSMVIIIAIPFLVLRAARYVLSWLGITEHRWKFASKDLPLSKQEREQLRDVIIVLRANKLPSQTLSLAVNAVASGSDTRPGVRMLAHLSSVTTALESTANFHSLPYDEVQQQSIFRKLADVLDVYAHRESVDSLDVLKSLRRTGKYAVQRLAKQTNKSMRSVSASTAASHFAFELLMQTTRSLPPVSRHSLLRLEDGRELMEVCSIIPLELSIQYLMTQSPAFSRHIAFMTQFPHLRPSDAKKMEEVQAMTINSRIHSLQLVSKDGASSELASYLRMGHASNSIGFNLCHDAMHLQANSPVRQALLAQIRFVSLEQLYEEIDLRRVCCVAQALPVIVRAIKEMCRRQTSMQSVVRSGSFLYVQQSLLSDLNNREGAYLQDLRGALDELSSSLQVRFLFRPSNTIEVQGRHIILSLDRDEVPDAAVPEGVSREELLSRTYGLTAVVFSCGVNVLQSLGFFLASDDKDTVQDVFNRYGMERITDYASQAGLSSSAALIALTQHYSPGALRLPKDVDSVWLVRDTTRELGGVRGVNCKSGKDRTAMEIALSFTQEASRQLDLSSAQQHTLCQAAMSGLSYELTSQNNGRPCAYAFNEFELVTMPPGWSPDWKLCGKVET